MPYRLLVGLVILLLISGCSGQTTVIYIVLSPTPQNDVVAAAPTDLPTLPPTLTFTPLPTATATLVPVTPPTDIPPTVVPPTDLPPTAIPATVPPAATLTPPPAPAPGSVVVPPTDLPPGFPTPIAQPIQVAEQLFEGGRMFWIQPTNEIWVLIVNQDGGGSWSIYQDTFSEDDPIIAPSESPPEGLFQPERGFGKVWVENDAVRQSLGWAVTPEFGYVSQYEYYFGGSVDAAGNYAAGPGVHVLYSLYGEQFRFEERDGTWQLGG
ncbi:MAG: hypothetical protein GYB67_10655 [Chloroflexi bacterium]|nr:hypothetical protein [Chloroflexota bacterium]